MKKTTQENTAKTASVAEQRKKLIDEYGQLDKELLPIKAKVRRQEELGSMIRSWFRTLDPEETHSAAGDKYEVIAGAARMQTHLAGNQELYEALGLEAFIKAASITQRSLEENLSDLSLLATLTRKERTGARQLVSRSIA